MRYLYSLLFYMAFPVILLRLWWRTKKTPSARRLCQRLGFAPKGLAGCVWIHSVSLGETIAATPLIRALQAKYPDKQILLTAMTATGLKRANDAFADSVTVVAVPYDLPDIVTRFLTRVQPKALIVMETELWPNLFAACARRNIPVILANARLSVKSAQYYKRIAGITREMFKAVSCVLPHAKEDGRRFLQLGMPEERMHVTGSLKYDLEISPELPSQSRGLRAQLGKNRPVWLAASTHPTEEELMLAAHKVILTKFPNALLVLVPRHPERFDAVADKISIANLTMVRRSDKSICLPETQVYLADSMGEMMLIYSAVDVACVAGSFAAIGGHNMIEPAALKKPVVTGPQLFNFAQISAAMLKAGGMEKVKDVEGLSRVINEWFTYPEKAKEVGEKAYAVAAENRGALARQLFRISEVLDKM